VLCTHGNLLASLLVSIDAAFAFDAWRTLGNPDLFEVACDDGQPRAYRRLTLSSVPSA
jgi:hypothetical protein